MLNRLLTAVAIVSLAAAVAVGVLWWRADHGRSDHVHLGADSATQTTFYTGPDRVDVEVSRRAADGPIEQEIKPYRMRDVLGCCLFVPGLWVAVQVRRRLRPRRPGSELPALGRR